MITPIQKIVSVYRKQRKLSFRNFAIALSDGLKAEDQVTYQTIKNWEDGVYQPNINLLLTLALTVRDWRGDFAFDLLSVMKPEIYQPMTSIGEKARQSNSKAVK